MNCSKCGHRLFDAIYVPSIGLLMDVDFSAELHQLGDETWVECPACRACQLFVSSDDGRGVPTLVPV